MNELSHKQFYEKVRSDINAMAEDPKLNPSQRMLAVYRTYVSIRSAMPIFDTSGFPGLYLGYTGRLIVALGLYVAIAVGAGRIFSSASSEEALLWLLSTLVMITLNIVLFGAEIVTSVGKFISDGSKLDAIRKEGAVWKLLQDHAKETVERLYEPAQEFETQQQAARIAQQAAASADKSALN